MPPGAWRNPSVLVSDSVAKQRVLLAGSLANAVWLASADINECLTTSCKNGATCSDFINEGHCSES